MKRELYVGASLVVVAAALGCASYCLNHRSVVQAAAVQAPRFEVDPLWPKPLPNHWIMGQTIGVSVDAQDHIWIIHRAGAERSTARMKSLPRRVPQRARGRAAAVAASKATSITRS